MDICNSSSNIIYNYDNYYDTLFHPLYLSWYSLLIIFACVYFLFIVISIVWVMVLGKRHKEMKKQLRNELDSESGRHNEEYIQLQYKQKALKLFILIIAVELIIGIILILPIMCMAALVSFQLTLSDLACYTFTINGTDYAYVYSYISSPTFTIVLLYIYGLSLLLQFGAFTFHTLTLAAIVQFYINIYTSRRDTVPLRKYLFPATLQFLSIIILSPFIVTAPIITLLLFIYYPIDLYFLIRNSRRLKHLLVVRRNEAALIGPEMLKEHESHLQNFKRIWGSFMISFVICIISQIIQSIFTSVITQLYVFSILNSTYLPYLNINSLFSFVFNLNYAISGGLTPPLLDIVRTVICLGYLQFLLYTIVSSIMYASVYLYKILKPCCKPRTNEFRPLLDEYRNDVLARNALNNNQEDAPINAFENNYIASTFFAK